jgi:hypothetical protein
MPPLDLNSDRDVPSIPAPACRHALAFDLPPLLHNSGGAIRRVGVEIEFMGLSARAAALALASELGGIVTEQDPHAFRVLDSGIGDLAVELDIRYAHPRAHGKELIIHLGPGTAARLGSALAGIVPRELITAPLPVTGLADMDRAVDVLRRAGAKGRGATLFGSLGLHFNIDPPRLDAETLTVFLKAFLLLEPWLRRETLQDKKRWRPHLPHPYPLDYIRRVLAPDYRPDLPTFTDDYLAANPTRNRSLDLLPILSFLDEQRVRTALPFEKIGARTVFHYRLPQASIGDPGWTGAPDWNRWVAVERLAGDPARLAALSRSAPEGVRPPPA